MVVLTNVFRRGGVFYFRARVPAPLRVHVQRDELWRSLKTSDPSEARRRGGALHGLTETLWSGLKRAMNQYDAQALVDAWLKAKLDEDTEVRRIANPDTLATHEAEQDDVFTGAIWRKTKNDQSIAARHVDELIAAHGLALSDADRDMVTRRMMLAHVDMFRAATVRADRRWRPWLDNDPAAPLVKRLEGGQAPAAATRPNPPARRYGQLSDVAREAIKDIGKRESFRVKRFKDYEKAVEAFTFAFGSDPDLSEITPEVAGRYVRDLTRYPSNPNKRLPYRDLKTFNGRIEAAQASDDANVLSAVTINGKYITPLRQIFAWARTEHRDLINPFDSLRAERPRKADPRKSRRDFTLNEVQAFFAQPVFTGAAGSRDRLLYRPGHVKIDDWRFWVPLIGLFSGMRLNEACGLAVADVKKAEGVTFFHVRDEIEGQSLKSVAARRKVPVHDVLVQVGFLTFVDGQREAGRVRLFEDLHEDASGYFSGIPSKFFGRLIDRIKEEQPDDPGKLVFHSTRHTVTTRLRAADVRMDVAKELIGHEQGEVHAGYGHFPLPLLRDTVNKIVYPGVNLSNIAR